MDPGVQLIEDLIMAAIGAAVGVTILGIEVCFGAHIIDHGIIPQ